LVKAKKGKEEMVIKEKHLLALDSSLFYSMVSTIYIINYLGCPVRVQFLRGGGVGGCELPA
jgi:hypothetical protein